MSTSDPAPEGACPSSAHEVPSPAEAAFRLPTEAEFATFAGQAEGAG